MKLLSLAPTDIIYAVGYFSVAPAGSVRYSLLSDKLELYNGGFHVARKLSLGTALVAAGAANPVRGAGLCCTDA